MSGHVGSRLPVGPAAALLFVCVVFGAPDSGSKADNPHATEVARIAPQTGHADGSHNNFRFYGGDWNSGHLRFGSGHLSYDGDANHFRVKEGPPTIPTDGNVN